MKNTLRLRAVVIVIVGIVIMASTLIMMDEPSTSQVFWLIFIVMAGLFIALRIAIWRRRQT